MVHTKLEGMQRVHLSNVSPQFQVHEACGVMPSMSTLIVIDGYSDRFSPTIATARSHT